MFPMPATTRWLRRTSAIASPFCSRNRRNASSSSNAVAEQIGSHQPQIRLPRLIARVQELRDRYVEGDRFERVRSRRRSACRGAAAATVRRADRCASCRSCACACAESRARRRNCISTCLPAASTRSTVRPGDRRVVVDTVSAGRTDSKRTTVVAGERASERARRPEDVSPSGRSGRRPAEPSVEVDRRIWNPIADGVEAGLDEERREWMLARVPGR